MYSCGSNQAALIGATEFPSNHRSLLPSGLFCVFRNDAATIICHARFNDLLAENLAISAFMQQMSPF
jgi:hypothetical protein